MILSRNEAEADLLFRSGDEKLNRLWERAVRIKTGIMKHLLFAAVIHTVPSTGEHVVDVDQGEHAEGPDQGAGLDEDATPQQGRVTLLVKQSPDHHLQVGEEAGEDDPGDDL